MTPIRVKRGYDLKLAGGPEAAVEILENPDHVAVLPETFCFIKPKLAVAEGDFVQIGSVLFTDKRNPDITFLSPGGGRVAAVNFGPRRVITQIVIELDSREAVATFESVAPGDLASVSRSKLVSLIMAGGLWPLVRQLPFRDMAIPGEMPSAIIVSIGNLEPFSPSPSLWLAENTALFEFGIAVLEKMADGRVMVAAADSELPLLSAIQTCITHSYQGPYPAHDPGALLYHTKKGPEENGAWFVNGQDVLLLAALLKYGRYPTARTVSVAGGLSPMRKHVRTRLGVPLAHLLKGLPPKGEGRFVAGGVLTGRRTQAASYLGLHETALTVLPEGNDREFFAFVRPGFKKPSFSKAFLSRFNRDYLAMDTNTHGELRACIACNHCPRVCPVDILPQLAYKALLSQDVEEALAHGLLDCVGCGLCSYVCPAKIELTDVLVSAKAAYYKELAG